MFEYDVLFAFGYSGTFSDSLPVCAVLFCVKFSSLTVQPEDISAKPVMMRIINTAFDSFIDTSITAVSNKPCGIC